MGSDAVREGGAGVKIITSPKVQSIAFGILMFAIGRVFGFYGGVATTTAKLQWEAIKAGHAEYVLHGSEAVWQWKEIPK